MSPSSNKIYRIPKIKLRVWVSGLSVLIGLLPLMLIGIFILLGRQPGMELWIFSGLFPLLIAFFGYRVYRWARKIQIALTPAFLICDLPFLKVTTNWSNIIGIYASRSLLHFQLMQPLVQDSQGDHWAVRFSLVSPRIINLSIFVNYWNNGELKADLAQYAPHLFVNNGQYVVEGE